MKLLIVFVLLLTGCANVFDNDTVRIIERPKLNTTSVPTPYPPSVIASVHAPIEEKQKLVIPGKQSKYTINDVEQQLSTASIAFSVPESANIKDTISVQLLVSKQLQPQELGRQLKLPKRKIETEIKVSKIISAKLNSPDFVIESITPEEQALAFNSNTEWLWKLKPKTVGEHEVTLSVTAIINVNERESRYHIKTFERVIKINITGEQIVSKWLDENFKWLLSTLIIPLLVFLFKDKVLRLLKKEDK